MTDDGVAGLHPNDAPSVSRDAQALPIGAQLPGFTLDAAAIFEASEAVGSE